jgi:anthranilate synthase component II
MRITLIDNFDSFTYNLVHLIGAQVINGQSVDVQVYRNNACTPAQIFAQKPDAIVLSPGPCTPNEAGICMAILREMPQNLPLLGVCLGHQALGQVFGGEVIRAPTPVHGKIGTIKHQARGIFKGINGDFAATRYHSLIVKRETLPPCLQVEAETQEGLIMGLSHVSRPLYGVQFHPESIASQHGGVMIKNFLEIAQSCAGLSYA